jgi:hypothetical protein
MMRPVEWYEDDLRGPEPRSRFLAFYLIAITVAGGIAVWWGW